MLEMKELEINIAKLLMLNTKTKIQRPLDTYVLFEVI